MHVLRELNLRQPRQCERVQIVDGDAPHTQRGCDAQALAERVRAAARARKVEAALDTYASIEEAYRGALGAANADDRILVFGSFFTVAGAIRARESPKR